MWNIETRTHLKEISISKSRIIGPTTVDELVKTNQFLAKSGPNTKWFDVSNDEYVNYHAAEATVASCFIEPT